MHRGESQFNEEKTNMADNAHPKRQDDGALTEAALLPPVPCTPCEECPGARV